MRYNIYVQSKFEVCFYYTLVNLYMIFQEKEMKDG
jgi:hypothetical protein